jgi:hypothetical protein
MDKITEKGLSLRASVSSSRARFEARFATTRKILGSPVFLTVNPKRRIRAASGRRRILKWLAGALLVVGSASVRFNAHVDATVEVNAQREKPAEAPGKLPQPQTLEAK